jgi:hypothetical protein
VQLGKGGYAFAIKTPPMAAIASSAQTVTPNTYAELVVNLSKPVAIPERLAVVYTTLSEGSSASSVVVMPGGKVIALNLQFHEVPLEPSVPSSFSPNVILARNEGSVAAAVERDPAILARVTRGKTNFGLDLRSAVKSAVAREASLALANTALIVIPLVLEQQNIDRIASAIDPSFALTGSDKDDVAHDIANGGNPQCEGVIFQKRIEIPFSEILPAGSAKGIQVPIVMTTESNNGLENIPINFPILTPLAVAIKLSEGNAIGCTPFRFAIQQPDENGNVLFRFEPSMDDKQKKWGIEVYDEETKIATIGTPEVMGVTTLDYYRGFKFRVPMTNEGKALEFRYSDGKTIVKITRDKENFIFVMEQKGTKT